MSSLPDPRRFPPPVPGEALHALAREALQAPTGREQSHAAEAAREHVRRLLDAGAAEPLEKALRTTPSVDVHRFVWRRLSEVLAEPLALPGGSLALHLFALPVVIVAASREAARVPGLVAQAPELRAALEQGRFLGGNRNFGLGRGLVGAETLGLARLAQARRAAVDATAADRDREGRIRGPHDGVLDFPPADIPLEPGLESAHLRFLPGTAVAPAQARLFSETDAGAWASGLTRHFARHAAPPGVEVLALARPAQPLLAALWAGRVAQREVALQLFVSNALRRLRAQVGEPVAVLSAHALEDGQGELRLSLSSPLEERDAEGFRFPLLPLDRVEDATATIVELLKACRVADVRALSRVYPDRDPHTRMAVLFKPGAIDAAERVTWH